MDTDVLIVAAVVVIGILVVGRQFVGGSRPKQQSYRCSRCSATSMHTARTIEAWRRGKTKFFCDACHGEWLRAQPQGARPEQRGRSGCLGAVVALIVVPAAVVTAYLFAGADVNDKVPGPNVGARAAQLNR
jgi:hypothetical protein